MLRHKIPVILAKKETVPKLMPVPHPPPPPPPSLYGPKGNTNASTDLLTDTAAILNLSKENFNVYSSGKRRSSLHPKTAQRFFFFFFFFHYNHFLGKLKEKLARKARVNNDASISDRAHAP